MVCFQARESAIGKRRDHPVHIQGWGSDGNHRACRTPNNETGLDMIHRARFRTDLDAARINIIETMRLNRGSDRG